MSSYFNKFWTPAFAGVTLQETFYEIIKLIRNLEFGNFLEFGAWDLEFL